MLNKQYNILLFYKNNNFTVVEFRIKSESHFKKESSVQRAAAVMLGSPGGPKDFHVLYTQLQQPYIMNECWRQRRFIVPVYRRHLYQRNQRSRESNEERRAVGGPH